MKLLSLTLITLCLGLTGHAQFVTDSLKQVSRVDDEYPSYSPDGSRIAFMSNRLDGNFEIYVMDSDGKNLTRLTHDAGLDETPVWSPDGTRIAFASDRQGKLDIFLMDPDGNHLQQVTDSPGNDDHPKFSTDGKYIIFNSDRDQPRQPTDYEIYEINLETGEEARKTHHEKWDSYPSYSPDHQRILWRRVLDDPRSPDNWNSEVFIMDRDGSNVRNLTNHPAFEGYPVWSPDGGHIAFVSDREGNERLYVIRPDGSEMVALTTPEQGQHDARPSFHPNGDRLVFNRITRHGTFIMTLDLQKVADPILFTEITSKSGLEHLGSSRGAAWGDYDQDGYADLVVANAMNQTDFLYGNQSGIDFRRINEGAIVEAGGWSEGAQWIDYDNDGDLDLFVATQWGNPNLLFKNQLDQGFIRAEAGALTSEPTSSTGACWCDYDNDGDLDVYVMERDGANDALFRNNGDGSFLKVEEFPYGGGDGRACIWGDTNGDGYQDLIVANYRDKSQSTPTADRNFYYLNQAGRDFLEIQVGDLVTETTPSYGLSLADFDEDGDQDLFITNVSRSNINKLYLNNGNGDFSPSADTLVIEEAGGPSKGQTWGDFDNDGDLDLYVANGTEGVDASMLRNYLYLNQGQGRFQKIAHGAAVEEAEISAGAAWADYDRDGDLDLFVSNWGNNQQHNSFYRNDTYGRHWIALKLQGNQSNSMGIGARVRVKTEENGVEKWQTRWMTNNTGYGSQNEPIIHFGLGGSDIIAELEIRWPSGQVDSYQQIEMDQYLEAVEGDGLEVL